MQFRTVSDIGIHGGGNNKNLIPDPYTDMQMLINTQGCFRMQNYGVNSLIQDIKALNQQEKSAGVKQSNILEFKRN